MTEHRGGRPRIADELLRPVTLAAPASLLARLDAFRATLPPWARATRSSAARCLLERALAAVELEAAQERRPA